MSMATQNHKNATKSFFGVVESKNSELFFNFLRLMFEIDILVCGESRNMIFINQTRV
jgi:hypothetical protein